MLGAPVENGQDVAERAHVPGVEAAIQDRRKVALVERDLRTRCRLHPRDRHRVVRIPGLVFEQEHRSQSTELHLAELAVLAAGVAQRHRA